MQVKVWLIIAWFLKIYLYLALMMSNTLYGHNPLYLIGQNFGRQNILHQTQISAFLSANIFFNKVYFVIKLVTYMNSVFQHLCPRWFRSIDRNRNRSYRIYSGNFWCSLSKISQKTVYPGKNIPKLQYRYFSAKLYVQSEFEIPQLLEHFVII